MDIRTVVKALLSKTVERGCTPQEAESAQAQARKLAEKHGLDIADLRREAEGDTKRQKAVDFASQWREDFKARKVREYQEFVRRQQEAKVRPPQPRPEERVKPKTKAEEPYARRFDSVRDFVENMLRTTTMTYEQIAAAAVIKFGGHTSAKSVAWYANKMRHAGENLPKRKRS